MRVCIVGGTGNISAAIVKLLLAVGHEVTLLNRGKSGPVPSGVRTIRADRGDRKAFENAVRRGRFDAGIDMICFNSEDARSTLRAFRGAKHVIFCSTVCVYGVKYDWLPATEDHPLRPISDYGRGKIAAENVFLEAWHGKRIPVTIIRPSTTFGPKWNMLRQLGFDASWTDRVRKGKPVAVCGDGRALHQWLHVDDIAPAFVFTLLREHCFGQVYNATKKEVGTWEDYHHAAMRVIGRDVELVGVPLANLVAAEVPGIGLCKDIFSYNTAYSPDRLMRDVPEFRPAKSLEDALSDVYAAMKREARVARSETGGWEDRIIAAQRKVAKTGRVRGTSV